MEEDVVESVIWFDPGGTTGWAQVTLYPNGRWDFSSGQLGAVAADLDGLFEPFFTFHGVDRLSVGWERYVTTSGGGKSGSPHYALEATGAIQGAVTRLAQRWPVVWLDPVPAASRTVMSVAALNLLGWYHRGQPHANDAAQHLGAYLLRTKPVPRFLTDVFTKLLEEDMVDPAQEAP